MKKADIAMIILIASVSVLVAYFVADSIFGDIRDEKTIVKTIDPITAEIVEPSPLIFNTNAINPAVEVQITGTPSATQSQSGTQ